MNNLEKLLLDLVSINSSNPDRSNFNPEGEKEIGNYIADYLAKYKIPVEKKLVDQNRSNIFAIVESNIGKKIKTKNILLCSHLDTVYLDGISFNPIKKDNFIFGPGACDAKASLVSMINALVDYSALKERNVNTYFLGAVGEESMHIGIKSFLKDTKLLKSTDFCIIGEPTNLNIGVAHKGSIRIGIKTIGVYAHGSMPESGINAIDMMAVLISKINKELLSKYKNIKNKFLGSPTLSIGIIKGGRAFNVVPNSCYIEIDRRVIPEEKVSEVLNDFKILGSSPKIVGKHY